MYVCIDHLRAFDNNNNMRPFIKYMTLEGSKNV